MTAQKLWFAQKLNVINDEFDSYIGALVASLVLKQHCLRSQAQANLDSQGGSANNE